MINDSRFSIWLKCAVLALLSSFILHPSSLRAQGSLTPPGAPAPTMKTLAQIESRFYFCAIIDDDQRQWVCAS